MIKHELRNRDLHVDAKNEVVNDTVNASYDTVNDTLNVPIIITKTQQKVLEHIRKNPNATAPQVALKNDISEITVKRAFSALKAVGMIERIGSDKTGHWAVK